MTEQRIPALSPDNLTNDQSDALAAIRGVWGEAGNIGLTMLNNPEVSRGFMGFWKAIQHAGMSKMDHEVICFEMAAQNGCHYCIPAHRYSAKRQGLDMALLERIAAGEELEGDARPAVLQRLVRRLVVVRGGLDDAEFAAARAQFSDAELTAIVADIAHCMFTNVFNRLARTETDPHLPTKPGE
jgi:AhpD family alkylhydroperoxidase